MRENPVPEEEGPTRMNLLPAGGESKASKEERVLKRY
jgi:hypothetical protein